MAKESLDSDVPQGKTREHILLQAKFIIHVSHEKRKSVAEGNGGGGHTRRSYCEYLGGRGPDVQSVKAVGEK